MKGLLAVLLVLGGAGVACTPAPAAPPPTPFGPCYDSSDTGRDLQVGQVDSRLNWIWTSTDGTCSGTIVGRPIIVQGADWAEATPKCNARNYQYAGLMSGSGSYNMPTPPHWFVCTTASGGI
jgi:hypothetical protein